MLEIGDNVHSGLQIRIIEHIEVMLGLYLVLRQIELSNVRQLRIRNIAVHPLYNNPAGHPHPRPHNLLLPKNPLQPIGQVPRPALLRLIGHLHPHNPADLVRHPRLSLTLVHAPHPLLREPRLPEENRPISPQIHVEDPLDTQIMANKIHLPSTKKKLLRWAYQPEVYMLYEFVPAAVVYELEV